MNEQQPADERKCLCGCPKRWADDPLYPIEFDEQTGEYQIVHNGARIFMQYCFNCGGRLPESKRGSLFTTPDEEEMAEIDDLLRNARSITDVIRILGEPDAIHEGHFDAVSETHSDQQRAGRVIPWKQQLDYRKRWESLELFVQESLDGTVAYVIGGSETSPGL